MKLELHPLCALFPRMAGAEFESLKADIKANGLRQPITTHQGMVLDGGNRYEACLAVGVEPEFSEHTGQNLVTYVMSANFHRRHLSPGQQAAIVASATDWARAQGQGRPNKTGSPSPLLGKGEALPLETVKQRAAVSGATERTQKDADRLVREKPDLARQVTAGEKSLYQAVKESKPAPVVHISDPVPPQDEYTELDAARDQIEELQTMLALANMNSSDSEEKTQAANMIAALREEIRQLTVNLKAVTTSRNGFQNQVAELQKQINRQRREIDKLTGTRTA